MTIHLPEPTPSPLERAEIIANFPKIDRFAPVEEIIEEVIEVTSVIEKVEKIKDTTTEERLVALRQARQAEQSN